MDEWDASDMSGLEDGFSLSPSPDSAADYLDEQMSDWNSDPESDLDLFGDLPASGANSNSSGTSSLDSDLPGSPISVNSQPSPLNSDPYQQQQQAGVAGVAAESSHSAQRRGLNLDNFFLPEISPEIIHVHNHHHHHHHGSGMMFSPSGHFVRRGGPVVPPARALQRNGNGPSPESGMSRGARRANGTGEGEGSRNGEDELIEMELEQRRAARQQSRRQSRRFSGQPPSLPPHGEQTIIDLTEEPDSLVQQLRPLPRPQPPPASRNPRRQMSLNHRTPSLARSDGSILVEPPPVIDLTEDSPDEARSPPRNNDNNNHNHHHHHHAHGAARQGQNHRHNNHSQSPDVAFMGIFSRLHEIRALNRIHRVLPEILQGFGGVGRNQPVDFEVQIIGHNPAAQQPMDNPLQGNPVLFNYQANGFGNRGAASPKPAFVPPPAARDGFTRATGESGGDMAVVCAGCDEELKYDPDGDEDGRPAKKARTRKDREEHHFWAVTTCGHVYCKRCFDTRTSAGKKGGELLGFRTEGKALYCAVDGCRSDVRQKRAWVGIFL